MRYLLMDKDIPVLSAEAARTEFGGTRFVQERQLGGSLPIGYRDMASWVRRRRAPAHRAHIAALLNRYSLAEPERYIRATRAVSLNDTFWAKEEGCALTWTDVSPYRNSFDETIAASVFGEGAAGEPASLISPEFGTDGAFAKRWAREGGQAFLLKRGTEGCRKEGLVPACEALASQVASCICPSYAPYRAVAYHGKPASKCPLFTDEAKGYVPFERVYPGRKSPDGILGAAARHGAEDAFRRMLVLDALILNIDRHPGNYGFLSDTGTMEILGPAPVFDLNRSLLAWEDIRDLEKRLGYCASRYAPRIGGDFVAVARSALTDGIRADLLPMLDFSFPDREVGGISGRRVAALEQVVRMQAAEILGKSRAWCPGVKG